jgi:hypothetical protein
MKKCVLLFGLFALTATFSLNAQTDNDVKSDDNVAVLAAKAAEADATIDKKVCEKSGKVSYVKKDVCEKSGKVSYTSVSYDAVQGTFVSLDEKAKDCSSKAKASSGCCASKGKATGVAGKDKKECSKECAKKCAKKGEASSASKKGDEAKVHTLQPQLTPQG